MLDDPISSAKITDCEEFGIVKKAAGQEELERILGVL
jgi:hypothetical protein